MPDLHPFAWIAVVGGGLLAGFIDSIAGGGGLIARVPPQHHDGGDAEGDESSQGPEDDVEAGPRRLDGLWRLETGSGGAGREGTTRFLAIRAGLRWLTRWGSAGIALPRRGRRRTEW